MYYQAVEKAEVNKCLLCHDAPCAKACPALDPARVLRSLRLQNETGASGIAAINTVKSITNVNLDTYATAPAVRGRSAVGGYSGAAVMQYGYCIIDDLLQGLRIHMAQRGYQTVRFDKETRKPILIPQNCVGCHLCVLVCPREAISGGGRRVNAVKMD